MADDTVTDGSITDLQKYSVYRKDRAGCQKVTGGGVAVIARKDLHTLRVDEYEVEGHELLWLKVVGWKMIAVVGVLYARGIRKATYLCPKDTTLPQKKPDPAGRFQLSRH
ncbi:hypothetical protein RvY_03672 [Ramazzottius varieornatus]|uniref:Uncharacterized protein n=1 Tax=Ramazzottius varieornatus TaxID=947166 RepID=A0A1D1UNX7_RAMVA|nr:hypothetical protein RvY_03672 [Ramazzottius varieornatus]